MFFPRQLTIQLRKRQLQDIYGNNIYYSGINPLSLAQTIGTIDSTWYDFTDYVDGLQDIKLEWSVQRSDGGKLQAGQYAPVKGVSGTLSFERNAYDFIKAHLIDDVAASLNEIEVQITDTSCGNYIGYSIKSSQLTWCEVNALCKYDITLKQIELYTNCIQRTIISDNWQGWFQDEPAGGKKHPRFSYCVEKRPNWSLVLEWYLVAIVAVLYTLIYTVFYPILLLVYAIITVINTIITAINTLPGISIPLIPASPPATPVGILEAWATLMIEAGGCGREVPAPLIRDYISNVCDKCGIRYDATTIDIFFAPEITLTHSDGVLHTEPNPHYNACYYFPSVQRGVRRFRKLNLLIGNSDPDTTTYYQPANAPLLSLDMFLDQLKNHYNAQWQLREVAGVPYLYFKRKDWFREQAPIYDFSFGGADRSKIIEGICYTPQEVKIPASCGNLYKNDPSDKCGTEARWYYNGDPISFNFTTQNPLFKGILDKETDFSPVKFNCDGASTNYLYDALQVCYASLFTGPGVFLGFAIYPIVGNFIERYANYAVLQQTEQISAPKIIIWDGDTGNPGDPDFLNARSYRDKINLGGTVFTIGHTPIDGTVSGIGKPDINTRYPSEVPNIPPSLTLAVPSTIPAPLDWVVVHPMKTDVIGRIMGTTPPTGVYAVVDPVGTTIIPAAAILVNYAMYFEPHYKGTLWDWFHWIDDPYRYPKLNKDWEVKIPLCCDDLNRLNLLGTQNGQNLLQPVLLDTPFYNQGIITGIEASYEIGDDDDNQSTGQYIKIKGEV